MRNYNDFQETKTVGGFYVDENKGYRDQLSSVLESVQSQFSMSPIDDVVRVLKNDILKESYKERLLEGYNNLGTTDPYFGLHADRIEQLFENSTYEILRESTVSSLSPIVGLTLPVLTKSYAESVAKDIVATEVSPQIVVKKQFERKFIKDKAGKKYYFPEIFYNGQWKTVAASGKGKPISAKWYPESDELKTKPLYKLNLLTESGGALEKRDSLSYDLHITKVKVVTKDSDNSSTSEKEYKVDIVARMDEQHITHHDITVYGEDDAKTPVKDTLVFLVDWYNGMVSVSSLQGAVTKVQFGGHLSNQNNFETLEVDRERQTFTWNMEEGVRINTGMTVERIKDEKSMMNNDWTAQLVSDMSSLVAQFEDNDVLDQLYGSFEKWKGERDFPLGYEDGFVLEKKFKCIPPTGSLLTTAEYLERELQYSVTAMINTLKNKIKESDIYFVMHGHPENMHLPLAGIDWILSDEGQMAGVSLGYKFGVTTNNKTRINVVSSLKEPKERGIMLTAYALSPNVFTFKTWKYSMNIENVYRNPLTPLNPNIMATSRYKFASLQPVQGRIQLVDNEYGLGVKNAG